MQSRFSQKQAGFTLIELVIVILILGILSAVALPRFLNLGQDARRAKAEAIHGSVRAAAQITRAGALVQGTTGATGNVSLDGGNIAHNYGYPVAHDTGIVRAANLNAGDDKVTISAGNTAAGSTITIDVLGATDTTTCRVSYQSPSAANGLPVISVVTTGC